MLCPYKISHHPWTIMLFVTHSFVSYLRDIEHLARTAALILPAERAVPGEFLALGLADVD
jgi:hypothetical protein